MKINIFMRGLNLQCSFTCPKCHHTGTREGRMGTLWNLKIIRELACDKCGYKKEIKIG